MDYQNGELIINTHDFEENKNEIKTFAQNISEEVELSEFKTKGGLFNWGNHNVTGTEMNNFTTEIQEYLIELNNRDKEIATQFKSVYKTFECLDKDYIQEILIAIKSAEEANRKTSRAIDALKKITTKLSDFKSKVDSIEHLYDIDNMWDYCGKWCEANSILSDSIEYVTSLSDKNAQEIENLKGALKLAENLLFDLSNQLNQQIKKFEPAIAFTNELREKVHLKDIDDMYDSLMNTEEELEHIKNTVSEQNSDITSLLSFMKKMSEFEHLEDVDSVWAKTETYAVQLEELKKQSRDTFDFVQLNKKNIDEIHKIEHLRDIDEIWKLGKTHSVQLSELKKNNAEIGNTICQNKESSDAVIAEVIEKNDTFVQTITKKIKYAYVLAGGTLGVAVIELIVILLKVI